MKQYSPPRLTTYWGNSVRRRRIGCWGMVNRPVPSFGPANGSDLGGCAEEGALVDPLALDELELPGELRLKAEEQDAAIGPVVLQDALGQHRAVAGATPDDPVIARYADDGRVAWVRPTGVGAEIYWWQWPQPAWTAVCPPVVPYWWAAAMAVSDSPLVWKLWLFPFALLFTWSVWRLLRRFAPGLEVPLLCVTVLSPTFLPALNYMIDIPALGLGLAALLSFITAVERPSVRHAVLSGVLAGVATQTKYTALAMPGVLLAYAVLARPLWPRLRLWLVASGIAAALFLAWEAFTAWRYGSSHFLYQLGLHDGWAYFLRKSALIPALATYVGGMAPVLLLAAAAGARAAGAGAQPAVPWGRLDDGDRGRVDRPAAPLRGPDRSDVRPLRGRRFRRRRVRCMGSVAAGATERERPVRITHAATRTRRAVPPALARGRDRRLLLHLAVPRVAPRDGNRDCPDPADRPLGVVTRRRCDRPVS